MAGVKLTVSKDVGPYVGIPLSHAIDPPLSRSSLGRGDITVIIGDDLDANRIVVIQPGAILRREDVAEAGTIGGRLVDCPIAVHDVLDTKAPLIEGIHDALHCAATTRMVDR